MRNLIRAGALSCAPLAAAQLSAGMAPFGPTSMILIPFMILAFPGILFIRPRDGLGWSYWAMTGATSSGILVAGLFLARLGGVHLTAAHAWGFLWALLVVAWMTRRHHLLELPRLLRRSVESSGMWRTVLIVAASVLAFSSARWVVPPQQDQDMVIANPVYGYVQHGKPYGTETHFAYIFSKPPLLHLQAGFVLLLMDRLEQAQFYWQSGRIVELLGEPPWAVRRFRRSDIESFELHPELVAGIRALTSFYAIIAPVLIADVARHLGASPATVLVGGLSYLLIPEVFVRMGYAGFTTPSTALLALGALLVLRPAPSSVRFLAGVLLALVNQKMLYIPVAYAAWRVAGCGVRGIRRLFLDPWLWGVVAGTAVWWAYGASVDWSTFLRDHFYYDFRDRFLLRDVSLGAHGPGWYPGVGGLWLEWARNLSPPLLALGIGGVVWGFTRSGPTRWLASWALLGWVLGSLTDWRQTKHLMLTIVPMAVTAQLLVQQHPRFRKALALVLAATALYNGVRIVNLWRDFGSLSPSTIW
ncbi:MAG: hypothetical protein MUE60_04075 [Candidatus Eisenbacteria bacterium]|nr:hypothetical protein [Candidatus Eisenbacteria bacterium]